MDYFWEQEVMTLEVGERGPVMEEEDTLGGHRD